MRESSRVVVLAALAILACAPAGGPSGASGTPPNRRTFLAGEEIRAANADAGSAYDAISRLRPNWLTRTANPFDPSTTESAAVFVDGRHYGALESLRNIDGTQIASVRFYSAAEAGGRFGMQGGISGVIDVTMKK